MQIYTTKYHFSKAIQMDFILLTHQKTTFDTLYNFNFNKH
jgi:hypothetical protein